MSELASTAVARRAQQSNAVVLILQLFVLSLLVVPSDAVIRAIGASGYLASLFALLAAGVWLVGQVLGRGPQLERNRSIRYVLLGLWFATLVSYGLATRYTEPEVTVLAAERWLLLLAGISGIALLAAEGLHSIDGVRRVARALTWGGAICGLVAALQYWLHLDVTSQLRAIPGFSVQSDTNAILSRAAVARVAGTSLHPIELGVVAGMLLPIALYLALCDRHRNPLPRWLPVLCIAVAIPISVSRSAVLSVVLAVGVFVALLPAVQRVIAFCVLPIAVAAVFMTAHGILSTLTSFFAAGTSDESVSTRVDDVPLVEHLVSRAPWFGRGGGTYMPVNNLEIFDNQYFKTIVELGIIGLVALGAYMVMPVVLAARARSASLDSEVRVLAGALVGSSAAAVVCAATFDALSFPMFAGLQALVVGLTGATWRLSRPLRRIEGAPS
jgi:O-antigen ligase